jgi:hypothetical protein
MINTILHLHTLKIRSIAKIACGQIKGELVFRYEDKYKALFAEFRADLVTEI